MRAPSLRLATQLSLVLCAISAFSTGMVLTLQERSLSSELEGAARQRLAQSAVAAERLLARHLEATAARYHAISGTPHFRANLEVDDGPTLGFYAKRLAVQQDAALIQFLDAQGGPRVRSGDKRLGEVARAAWSQRESALADARATDARTFLLAHEGGLFAAAVVPLRTRGQLVGRLLAVEAIPPETVSEWSDLCGGRIYLGEPGVAAGELDVALEAFDGVALRMAGSLDAEREALAETRARLLAAGAVALALAFAASILLARRLARPILRFRDAADRIARGDLDVRLEESRGDEIGDVARAFDHMASRLQTTLGEIRYLAYHDGLTGLGNRILFEEHLQLSIEQARREGLGVAVLFVDLDHFKYVNDTLGHTIGDHLLREMADRLLKCLQDAGLMSTQSSRSDAASVARFGGDEFTLLLPGIEEPHVAGRLARRILRMLETPFRLDGHEVTVSASIGISLFPEDGQDPESLMRSCDTAMYHAKQQGRNHVQFFAAPMNEVARKRLLLESRLRRAIDDGALRLHYQPKLDVASQRVTSLEALARWHDAELGVVAPDEFVALAEDSGLIHELGDQVLRSAIAQQATWQRSGCPPLRVAMNLSAQQLRRDGLVERIAEIVESEGADPASLEIEITESVLMDDEERSIETLAALRALGLHVSLDDFGTGYSSLSHLRRLPIDGVKIDQSFIRRVEEDPEDAAIVSAMVSLVKVLKLRVVAEGVETEGQKAFVEEIGCDEIQGFLVSAAVEASQVPKLVETWGRKKRSRRRRTRRAG